MTSKSATSGTARETVFDVDAEKLARIYAQAGLGAAGADVEGLAEELKALVTGVLDKFPALEQVFDSALVSQDEKLALLDRVFGNRLSVTTLNLLKVMASHGRLGMVRHVARSVVELWQHQNNHMRVQVQTAHALDAVLEQELSDTLRKVLNCELLITTEVRPELIGGFVVRMGDRVLDASTRTSLDRTRQAMIERAIEAIQNQPEQFSDQRREKEKT